MSATVELGRARASRTGFYRSYQDPFAIYHR